jgi:hypothetical protein
MAGEAYQNPPVTTEPTAGGNKSNFKIERDASTTSSTIVAAIKMADNKIPEIFDYWKKLNISEANRQAYHDFSWLTSNLISSIRVVDVGLPPSKFVVSIMNFLECELVHFNPNTIAALSYFTMLCECWLGIMLDTRLFWYFYSLARYIKVVYFGIGLSLHRHRIQEYIDATFKSSWLGSQLKWFLVDIHV